MRRYDLTPMRLVFLIGLVVFFGAFMIYPLLYILTNAVWVDGQFTLAFFGFLFSDPQQWQIVLNSVNLGLAVMVATTILTVPLAIAMVRYEFKGKSILGGLMDLGLVFGPIDWFGGGGMLGVVVLEVLHLYPIMYLNVAAALANVDPSMEEAARNVGANGWTLFRRVTFPLMLPGYFAGASIVFIWAFTDLGTPLIFEYRQVVPVQIFNMLSDIHENPMGYVLVVVMVVMSVGFFYLSKMMMGEGRYQTMARGHVASAVRPASGSMTAIIYTGVLGLTALALIPHMSVVLTSFAERWFMTALPETYTSAYYGMVFDHSLTASSIRNSLFLSSLSTVVDIVVGIGVAFLLARTRMPGKQVLDVLTMLPLAVPGIIIAFGYVASYSGTFLDVRVNPVPLLIFGYAVRRLPYMVRSAYAGLQQTSATLEEAAQNVGATPATTLRRITLPLVFANLVAGGILCFSFAMLEVSDSLILAVEERYYPITKAIYALLGRPDGPYIASALGVLGMLLLMVSLFLAGKFLGRRMGELFRA
jgi:iron(III) transport system permease protein